MDKNLIEILDADLMPNNIVVYPEFKPYFSKYGIINFCPVRHGLFEPEDKKLQIGHGRAIWDDYGWSRDRWVF